MFARTHTAALSGPSADLIAHSAVENAPHHTIMPTPGFSTQTVNTSRQDRWN
eukprot:m.479713 g.479713  ORF g.479713 m.479713 type:complete len:52 (-) comp50398_c0_seq1:262-417(-)